MSANTCTRCGKALSSRDQSRTTCPFCSAPLERAATRPLDAPPAEDEGYASFQVSPVVKANATPPPSPKLAAPGLTPASPSPKPAATGLTPGLTASAKSLRMTMAFGGAPALSPPLPALSPPLPAAPARTAAPAPAAVAAPATAQAAALAPAIRTPAPVSRTPAPPAQRPAPTPAVAPPPAPPARNSATVKPLVADSESEPTHVRPPGAATDTNLLADSDLEEPTHVREPGTVTPSLTFPDSEPIASVTMEPDDEPPVVSARVLLPTQPRRGLALVGLGMGLAIVGVAFAGVKLLGGPRATPASVSTRAVAAPAEAPPVIAAIEPAPAPPRSEARAATPPRPAPPPAKSKVEKRPAPPPPPPPPAAKAKAVPATIAHVAAPPRAAAPVEDRRATGRHGGKRQQRQATRARKVAMKAPAAKHNAAATTTTTTERGDPRPHYERGNALLFAGDSKGAIAAYREAIRAAPADPSAFRGLGLAYEQQAEPVFAARALRRYLKLAPNAPDREIVARRLERLSHQAKKK